MCLKFSLYMAWLAYSSENVAVHSNDQIARALLNKREVWLKHSNSGSPMFQSASSEVFISVLLTKHLVLQFSVSVWCLFSQATDMKLDQINVSYKKLLMIFSWGATYGCKELIICVALDGQHELLITLISAKPQCKWQRTWAAVALFIGDGDPGDCGLRASRISSGGECHGQDLLRSGCQVGQAMGMAEATKGKGFRLVTALNRTNRSSSSSV